MNIPTVDIKAIILAGIPTANITIGQEQESPNEVVTLFDTGGYPRKSSLEQGFVYEYPTVQVRVRSASYPAAFALIQAICTLLHNTGPVLTDAEDANYWILQTLEPMLLDYDESNRPRFIANFNIQRTPN